MGTCANCKFWELNFPNDSPFQDQGECRRRAPVNGVIKYGGVPIHERVPINTNEEYWCGEWNQEPDK